MAIEHLMVAAPLVETEVGREYDSLPPYLTIFPWFDMPSANWTRFSAAIRRVVDESMQPAIKWGDPALFGEIDELDPAHKRNRPARNFNVINGYGVHTDVHLAIVRAGGDFDPSHVGSHWHPLVRNNESYKSTEGQRLILPELAVFQRESAIGAETIRAVYKWEKVSV